MIEQPYSALEANMTSSVTAKSFSAAMLARIPFGPMLWRKHDPKLNKKDQQWRNYQLARLEYLKDCIEARPDLASAGHPELQSVPSESVVGSAR
jgi:hypothetical protein